MRQPLEDGKVTISRAAGTMAFPADFMLVAAMNPCPCGYFGDPARECRCSPAQVERYRSRISGPLLDRIDIHVEAPAVRYRELSSNDPAEASFAIRERVIEARARQRNRFAAGKKTNCNARMGHGQIKKFCALDTSGQEMLRHAMEDLQLSARIGEAIQYRTLDRKLWM